MRMNVLHNNEENSSPYKSGQNKVTKDINIILTAGTRR